MSVAPPKVLLVGSCLTLAAKVARCLDLAGLKPIVLGTEQVRSLGLLPECAAFVHWDEVRWSNGDLAGGLSQLNEVCGTYGADIVVPTDFATTLFLAKNRSSITTAKTGPLPDPVSMCELHDKWLLTRRMDRLGIRHPKSILARSSTDLLEHGLSYPILTKPLEGSFGIGIRQYSSPAELEVAAHNGFHEEWPILVQEFIEGDDVDMSFLAVDGKLLAHSVFRHGKHSRCFVEAPELKQAVETLLSDARYTGVGHIDTRHRGDGYHILELNPRFWGSLLYERRAGVNYPELFVRTGLATMPEITASAFLGVVRPSIRDAMIGHLFIRLQKAIDFTQQWKSNGLGTGTAN